MDDGTTDAYEKEKRGDHAHIQTALAQPAKQKRDFSNRLARACRVAAGCFEDGAPPPELLQPLPSQDCYPRGRFGNTCSASPRRGADGGTTVSNHRHPRKGDGHPPPLTIQRDHHRDAGGADGDSNSWSMP